MYKTIHFMLVLHHPTLSSSETRASICLEYIIYIFVTEFHPFLFHLVACFFPRWLRSEAFVIWYLKTVHFARVGDNHHWPCWCCMGWYSYPLFYPPIEVKVKHCNISTASLHQAMVWTAIASPTGLHHCRLANAFEMLYQLH